MLISGQCVLMCFEFVFLVAWLISFYLTSECLWAVLCMCTGTDRHTHTRARARAHVCVCICVCVCVRIPCCLSPFCKREWLHSCHNSEIVQKEQERNPAISGREKAWQHYNCLHKSPLIKGKYIAELSCLDIVKCKLVCVFMRYLREPQCNMAAEQRHCALDNCVNHPRGLCAPKKKESSHKYG